MKEQSEINQLIDHLFRYESGRLVAVLTKIFGSDNLELSEDVVQDSLVEAIKLWTYKGIPDNPSAWLSKVAKNKALNIVNREKYKKQYSSEVSHFLQSQWTAEPAFNLLFSEDEILDDQLRMMFICCHPSVSPDSQVALALKTLCGFNISEIAKAFLTSEENIKKRLVRARKKVKDENIPFVVPQGMEFRNRLQSVLECIYLLFNEGYNASSGTDLIRYELCEEAIRLTEVIIKHPAISNNSNLYALLALMQLNASRFRARCDESGNILTLENQNRALWDYELMEKGFLNLEKAAANKEVSLYHILASISAYHCSAANYSTTNWQGILSLYDKLVEIDNSVIVQLNRAVALSKVSGAETALAELEKISHSQQINSYYLFHSAKAEMQIELNQFAKAASSLEQAIALAPLQSEKLLLTQKLEYCFKKII